MALLRWLHLRKLTPIADVIAALTTGSTDLPKPPVPPVAPQPSQQRPAEKAAPKPAPEPEKPRLATGSEIPQPVGTTAASAPIVGGDFKEAFLAEVRRQKKFFYGTVIAQAQRIDVARDRVTFVFGPAHKTLRAQLEQSRPWLETMASEIAGRKVTVLGLEGSAPSPGGAEAPTGESRSDREKTLKARALQNEGVQAMLEVFGAEIKNVEEM
jgi:hypothetical protein